MMASVFAHQGLGQLTAALVSFICIARYKEFLQDDTCDASCQYALDQSWRILYGLGIVPALVALYFRLTLPESVRYTLDVKGDEISAEADTNRFLSGRFGSARSTRIVREEADLPFPKASLRDFITYFGKWKTGKVLLGTALSWLLLDVSFVSSQLVESNFSTALASTDR
jgi:PHS family inorganic phosphate transporter-like MFS transporter